MSYAELNKLKLKLKLNKDGLILIAMDLQKTQKFILSEMKDELSDMENELSGLRRNYNKL